MDEIKLYGIARQYQNLKDEILDTINTVFSSGILFDGQYTKQFEKEIAKRTNRKYAISINSCTNALLLTSLFYGSVLLNKNCVFPNVSFIGTINPFILTGFKPRLLEVDSEGLLDLSKLNLQEINPGILVYVNLCGNMLDYNQLKLMTSFFSEDQPIIEDAAQSFGASYDGLPSGKAGEVSVLSFDPTKNLSGQNGGGMVLTDCAGLAESILNFRNNGKHSGHREAGTNSRMSEVDCAILLVKLKYFDTWQKRRTEIAKYYSDRIYQYVDVPSVNPLVKHAWSKYVIQTVDMDLVHHLKAKNIHAPKLYQRPLSQNMAVSDDQDRETPMASEFCNRSVNIPIYPELTDSEVEYITESIISFYV